jgi:predicted aminopeptidase
MAGYDRWFAGYANQGPNNASLTSVALYTARVPAFRALLAQEGDSLPGFYARVKEIAALPKAARDELLDRAVGGLASPGITLGN